MTPSPAPRYTAPARLLHWSVAALVLAALVIACLMTDLPVSPRRLRLFSYHKWIGIGVLLLTLVRLGWRAGHRPPPLPATTGAMQRRLAGHAHRLLYLMCVLVPLLGWAYSCAAGFPVVWLGLLPLPDIAPVDEQLAAGLKTAHHLAAWTLVALAGMHLAAALQHQLVLRDGLLRRMLVLLAGAAGAMLFGALPLLAVPVPAAAQTLVPARSEIVFVSRQMGVPVEGRFRRFTGVIRLEPRQASGGQATLDIDLASVAIPGEETARELAKPGWFDSARVASARFESTQIRALGADRYEVAGRLTIKGISQPVTMPVAVARNGRDGTATGAFVIKRLAFRIGDGDWNDTSLVADDVQVRFRLQLEGMEETK